MFDVSLLFGRKAGGVLGTPMRKSPLLHRERKLRHRYAVFARAENCKDRAYRAEDTPPSPPLPVDWNKDWELPYSLVLC